MNEPKVSEESKKLVDQRLINEGVDQNVQEMINKPQLDPTGIEATDKQYFEAVIRMIKDGSLELHTPRTLMNKDIYASLDEKSQGIADINAVTLLNDLRQMKKLYDMGETESFQIKNLIQRIRSVKERIEKQCGDVYII
ncbi:hypothetical protein GF369_04375 [Candidatus Peregrinibacteria bacterium]|nr:hypothetical protein [Candidatus Peregrinibacteria bacterium]